jgi:uncharacterized C2H2 Zn-finger protein
MKEETGHDGPDFYIYTDEYGGEIIKKCPRIGPIIRRRSREHYYVIKTTSFEYTTFKPKKYEITVNKYSFRIFIINI